jgi:DNA-binding response OmpR family regulator
VARAVLIVEDDGRMLPGRSGFEVCQGIRRVCTTPVTTVTARADMTVQ